MAEARILIGVSDWRAAADIRKSLRDASYPTPVSAATGEEALRVAVTLNPDLAVLEIDLKGSLDGIQAATLIKQHLDIQIVFLSDRFDANVFERAQVSRPSGWVIKPFSSSQLQATLENALRNPPAIALKTTAEHLSERDHRELQREDSWLSSQAEAVIPMCSCCKQVRQSEGAWISPETYFAERFGIRFTHSLCPECVKVFRPAQ